MIGKEEQQPLDMYFCPLFSGSSGNALFCQVGQTRLLIDAGKSGRTIENALAGIGADIRTLSGVFITHEHADHIGGAGVLARKYRLPLYATRGTWQGMEGKIGPVPPELRHEIAADRDFYLGEVGVSPFAVSHDAMEPVGFRLWSGGASVSTATDLGVFTENVFSRIAGSSLVLLESNHDPDLLRNNAHYSPALRARIAGDRGHLSNAACAEALLRLLSSGVRDFILGHLSGENNTPLLARRVAEEALSREGVRLGEDVRMDVALRDTVGSVYIIQERE